MRIAHLVPQLDPLSSEPTARALVKYRSRRFREQIAACPGLDPDRAAKLEAAGVAVRTEVEPARVYAGLAEAGLIHVHCPSAAWGAKFLEPLRRTGRPLLFTLHGTPPPPAPLPELCVCTSAAVYESQSRLTQQCEWIEMGVDLERFRAPAGRPVREHLVVTRIGDPLRHAEYLWPALAEVVCRHPELRLQIIGGRGTGTGRVRAVEAGGDLTAALEGTDLIVAAPQPGERSVTYGVMAAMAMGVPAVLADNPDMRSCASPGETALLVPEGDAEALEAAIEALLRDAALRRQLGAAGRERAVHRFDVRDRVRQYEGVYARLLEASRGAPVRSATERPRGLLRSLWGSARASGRSHQA